MDEMGRGTFTKTPAKGKGKSGSGGLVLLGAFCVTLVHNHSLPVASHGSSP
jgi:hypothetical protein